MPVASVTSVRSDRVTEVRRLHDRSGRRKSGRFIVEGPTGVAAAFASHAAIVDVFCDVEASPDILRLADTSPVDVTWVATEVLVAMAETKSPQGILAVCPIPLASDVSSAMGGFGPVVVLDAVSDPGNVGTIIRTADAAGAACVVLGPGSADPFSGKVVRSTAGSIFHLPVVAATSLDEAISVAQESGRIVRALTGEAPADVFGLGVDAYARTCWIVGSEAHGISESTRDLADELVRIPMVGRAESLNAATACAIALYASATSAGGLLQGDGRYGASESGAPGRG